MSFNPSEARDEFGRWSNDGGGSAGGGTTSPAGGTDHHAAAAAAWAEPDAGTDSWAERHAGDGWVKANQAAIKEGNAPPYGKGKSTRSMNIAFTRAAGTTGPTTLDRTARTVEAIALSGPAPALRPGPAPDRSAGPWVEELAASGCDLTALRGAPALMDHVATVRKAVGSVADARLQGDQISVRLAFDTSQEADSLIAKIGAGSVRGVSLGYWVQRWQRLPDRNGRPVFRAVQWAPYEISFVPCPVDAGAQLRGATMTTPAATPATNPAAGDPAAVVTTDPAPLNRAAINASIRSIGEIAGLDRAWVDAQIDAGRSADEARAAAFTAMQKRSKPAIDNRSPAGHIVQGFSGDDPAVRRRGMVDALAHQFAPQHCKIDGAATQYRGFRALDIAATLLETAGERVNRYDRETLLTRSLGAHSTSDFPGLLADAANKALLAQYQAAQPTYRKIAAQKSFQDFKSHKFLHLGDFPTFKEITAEGGSVQYGTISENKETVTPKEFATGIVIGRKALLNDDLSALSDFSSLIAVRSAAFENSTVYAVLASNGPTMSDGNAMFHSSHGNLAAAGSTIASGIDAAVLAFRSQTGLDGLKINVSPKYLVVGPAQEANARRLLAAINPTTASAVNAWAGMFELVVDAEISGNRWFLVADPAQVPTLVFGYVNGAAGPQIVTETDFDSRAVKVRAGLDFAAGAVDYRGWYSNAGA